MTIAIVPFTSYAESVPAALDEIGAGERLAEQTAVLIKPNLVNASPPPVTTPVECCEVVVEYVRRHSEADVVIAEGCGVPDRETPEVFEALGYTDMAERLGVPLVDLNTAPTVRLERDDCEVLKEFHLPEIARTRFIISVPVLKAHSIAEITGSLKNMMGFAPPERYQEEGHWKKSFFHRRMQRALVELNRYRTPDLTVLDASVGLKEYHLGGPECDPPLREILAGFNAREVDRAAAGLLGMDWWAVPYLVEE